MFSGPDSSSILIGYIPQYNVKLFQGLQVQRNILPSFNICVFLIVSEGCLDSILISVCVCLATAGYSYSSALLFTLRWGKVCYGGMVARNLPSRLKECKLERFYKHIEMVCHHLLSVLVLLKQWGGFKGWWWGGGQRQKEASKFKRYIMFTYPIHI